MSKTLLLKHQLAEAKGQIPEGMAVPLTYATILEVGAKAALEGYFGKQAVAQAITDARGRVNTARAEQLSLDVSDSMLEDIKAIRQVYGNVDAFMQAKYGAAAHSTSDFPLALANLRQRTLLAGYQGAQSMWRSWIRNVRSTPDFKQLRNLTLGQVGELKLRPEGSDVQFTTLSESAEGYMVGNYERAFGYTWEMWLNDEVGLFARALSDLGRGAMRTEAVVIFNSIADGLSRSVETGVTTGEPTITNVTNARKALAARTFTDADGEDVEIGLDLTDLVYGTAQRDQVNQTLNQETSDGSAVGGPPNPVRGAFEPHLERLWSRAMGTDWVGFDNQVDWMEVAFLEGFESGPKTYTRMPNVNEQPNEGSFENHTLAVKVGHVVGASVIDANGAIRVQGA